MVEFVEVALSSGWAWAAWLFKGVSCGLNGVVLDEPALEASRDRFANLFRREEDGGGRFELTGETQFRSLGDSASVEALGLFKEGVLGVSGGGRGGAGAAAAVVLGEDAARLLARLGVTGTGLPGEPKSDGPLSRDPTVWRRLPYVLVLLLSPLRGVVVVAVVVVVAASASLASSWLTRASMAAAR